MPYRRQVHGASWDRIGGATYFRQAQRHMPSPDFRVHPHMVAVTAGNYHYAYDHHSLHQRFPDPQNFDQYATSETHYGGANGYPPLFHAAALSNLIGASSERSRGRHGMHHRHQIINSAPDTDMRQSRQSRHAQESYEYPNFMHPNWSQDDETIIFEEIDQNSGLTEERRWSQDDETIIFEGIDQNSDLTEERRWSQDDETIIFEGIDQNSDLTEERRWSQDDETIIFEGIDQNSGLTEQRRWSQNDETIIFDGIDQNGGLNEERSDVLTEDIISKNLETRKCNGEDEESICVVCQDGLCQENQTIGTLGCGHEYHTLCIKRWLIQKNICPLCKTTALSIR